MEIERISISNIRGIKDEVTFEPAGKSMVFFGPNGTGKSTVVDAIEFLFTGNISRLSGRGSKGMTLKDHGKHIDSVLEDSYVSATVKVDGSNPIEIKRAMHSPKVLSFPNGAPQDVMDALDIAENGYNFISKADVLKYIAAESGKRAEEVQAILDVDKAEDIRKAFAGINRDAARAHKTDSENFNQAKASIASVLDVSKLSEGTILKKINELRSILGGAPIDSINVKGLKKWVDPPAKNENIKDHPDPEKIKQNIADVKKLYSDRSEAIYEKIKDLNDFCDQNTKECNESDKLKKIVGLGKSMLDGSGECPLCKTRWEPETLKSFLIELEKEISSSLNEKKKFFNMFLPIRKDIDDIMSGQHIRDLLKFFKKFGYDDVCIDVEAWIEACDSWKMDAINGGLYSYVPPDETKVFDAISKFSEYLKEFEKFVENIKINPPEDDTKQKAWDTLTLLGHALERYFDAKQKLSESSKFSVVASALDELYTDTKDTMLCNIFDAVSGDFSEYYRYVHGDESEFQSDLVPGGAKLDLNVNFYGRGDHPPRALHSEGHQDSMGLCLYLAILKNMSEGAVKFMVLDDVMTSIDSDHRRRMFNLLMDRFPDLQFFVTTHSAECARQLGSDCFMEERNLVEFTGWDIGSGPVLKGWQAC